MHLVSTVTFVKTRYNQCNITNQHVCWINDICRDRKRDNFFAKKSKRGKANKAKKSWDEPDSVAPASQTSSFLSPQICKRDDPGAESTFSSSLE